MLFVLAAFLLGFIPTHAAENCGERSDSSWKWYARIIHTNPVQNSVLCGATLLNSRFVLTVAHCLFDLNGYQISTNELWILIQDGEERSIEISYHPNEFNVETLENDVVLILMDRDVLYNALVGAACLWPENDEWKLKDVIVPSLGNQTLEIVDERTCLNNTLKVFQLSYEGAVCLGTFKGCNDHHIRDEPALADSLRSSQPTVSLVGLERSSSRTVCHGILISPRFVLATMKCAKNTGRIFIPYGSSSSEWFNDLKFHHEQWENKVTLIELDRDASDPNKVLSCLWRDKRNRLYDFTTYIAHPGTFIHIEGIRVQYRVNHPLQVKYYCSRYLHPGQFARAGDAIVITKNKPDSHNRVVGLLDDDLECESWDYFYERQKTVEAINLNKYLPWIEDVIRNT
ncbi:acrosin-like isoform X2 [Wyeomyia smithii]|uniref:acrosin-like isoform X2 n=1 Tax=Wyeomyia smithii TaxID=174621 RepID=UPI002467E08A|nr:acrosin-like isoform X2 [Wyeomyia smithii]